jgi:hypothetical protein
MNLETRPWLAQKHVLYVAGVKPYNSPGDKIFKKNRPFALNVAGLAAKHEKLEVEVICQLKFTVLSTCFSFSFFQA